MSKYLKLLILIIGVILIVIIAGYFAIKAYLTPATIRAIATNVASEAVKRPVKIGKVGLKFGFKVGITIDDVSLPNVKGFTPGPMIQVDKTTLNLRLLPLLTRRIIISGLDFSGIKINIERNKQGELNFATFGPKEKKGKGWSLSLSAINISKGEIKYVDSKSKTEIQIKDFKQKFKFKGNKIFTSGKNTTYILKNKSIPEMVVKISNDIEYDTLKKNIKIKKLSALYEPIYLDFSGTIEKMELLSLKANLKIDDMSKMKPLIPINSRPAKLSGALKSNFSVLGTVKKPKIDGQCKLKNVTIVPKGMDRGIEKIHGSLSFNENTIRNIILHGKIGNTTLDVSGSIVNLKTPTLNLTTKIDGNLHDFEAMTTEMKSITMKGPVQANMTVKGKAKNPSYSGDYNIRDAHIDGIGLAKPITNLNIKGSFQANGAKINKCSGQIGRYDF
ncbi:MAG: AsmA family protein, partial [Candidatus Hodarchaeota archaeon]